MTRLGGVLKYLEGMPLTLDAGNLIDQDRVICYSVHRQLYEAVNKRNPSYRSISDLMRESMTVIKEMRDDIERMILRRYSHVNIIDEVLFVDVLDELRKIDLDNYQNCTSYLTDLAIASHATIVHNEGIREEIDSIFNAILYVCVVGINLFNEVGDLPPIKKGVEISFVRKRKQQLSV